MDNPKQWSRIESIFHGALERNPPDRPEYLSRECAGDDDLRKRVESLLENDDQTSLVDKLLIAPVPEQILGCYRLVSILGEGGMGTVYLARDTRLDREVALKVLNKSGSDADRKRRLLREAKAASALNHPNIVTVYDVSTVGEVDFLVMEYVAGKPLDRLIPRNGLKVTEATGYALQIADALACAHRAGIIHRDLKPANVLITQNGVTKVADFGIAKQVRTGGDPGTIDCSFSLVPRLVDRVNIQSACITRIEPNCGNVHCVSVVGNPEVEPVIRRSRLRSSAEGSVCDCGT